MDLKKYIMKEVSIILDHYHGDRINEDIHECICEDIERKLFGPNSWYTAEGQIVDLYSVRDCAPNCKKCRHLALGYVTLSDGNPAHYCALSGLKYMREITVSLDDPCEGFNEEEE